MILLGFLFIYCCYLLYYYELQSMIEFLKLLLLLFFMIQNHSFAFLAEKDKKISWVDLIGACFCVTEGFFSNFCLIV